MKAKELIEILSQNPEENLYIWDPIKKESQPLQKRNLAYTALDRNGRVFQPW